MIPRKKRILILISSIIFVVAIIVCILIYLLLNTDIFKSKDVLFAKYFMQNFNTIEILKNNNESEIKNKLDTNKYTSEVIGKIQYTENIGTSNENENNPINKVGIKINSNVDESNNYNYKDIAIGTDNEDLLKLEYLNQDKLYGIRLNGIQQFISTENKEEKILEQFEVNDIERLTSKIDIASILNFPDEEKQALIDTYIGIIQSNVSKDKYEKQSNALITVNNRDVKTNAYSIKFTIEEYNNLYIKILEQITKDEIILSRIDLIENEIKKKFSNYEQEESLREIFVNKLKEKIENIQNNNIGSEQVKITVYESDGKTVRTSIEKQTNKIIIDLYDDSSIKIDSIELGNNTNEQFIKIEKNEEISETNMLVEYEKIKDNEIVKDILLNYKQKNENDYISTNIELQILNEKYKSIFKIEDNTKIVQGFENQITLNIDNVKLSDLQEEQINTIQSILNENMQAQLQSLFSVVEQKNYIEMLQNLGIVNKNSVQLPSEGGVTDIQRKRFNSQFEFFVSEDLTKDNIKELMQVVQNNFEDMKVLLKDDKIEDLDMDMLDDYQQASEYKENISEILIFVKQNSTNDSKKEDTLEFVEDNNFDKYSSSIEYDNDGLVRVIRIKIHQN